MARENNWSSSRGFVLACAGAAVGLGNLWRFPYVAWEHGGGAFVLVYLACVLVVGLPVLLAEMALGRHGGGGLHRTLARLAGRGRGRWFWRGAGLLAVANAFFLLSFYSVVAGWTVEYFLASATGGLSSLSPDAVAARFGDFVADPVRQTLFHTVFMAATAGVLLGGTRGIERAVTAMMPLLLVLASAIAAVSVGRHGISDTMDFLLTADFGALGPRGVLEALGHAFFTLALGAGVVVAYGARLGRDAGIVGTSLATAALDTLVALAACLMLYPVILGSGVEVRESTSILFTGVATAVLDLPGGDLVGALFFLLVAFAALTSTISLLESVASFAAEELGLGRRAAVLLGGGAIWLVGLGSALSNGGSELLTRLGVMAVLDDLVSNWGLPLAGLLASLAAGWLLPGRAQARELGVAEGSALLRGWVWSSRALAPLLIALVLLFKVGVLS